MLQTWYQQAATTQQVKLEADKNGANYNVRLLSLCKKGKAKGKQQEVLLLLSSMIQSWNTY